MAAQGRAALSATLLFAAGVYVDTVFFHPDARGGLVFLFIALWQRVGAAAGLIIAAQLEARARVNDPT
jgi:Ni,Fe-hydrogenase I cytochrome b subunit